MKVKTVKDLMIPLSDYAIVNESSTLWEAFKALENAQKKLKSHQYFHRAVLVKNNKGQIVGKLGHLCFLRALEPKYSLLGDLNLFSKARINQNLIDSMFDSLSLINDDLIDVCKRAKDVKIKKVMRPITDSIQEDASLPEALHSIVISQALSLLVIKGKEMVGIIRLSDIFDEVSKIMKRVAE